MPPAAVIKHLHAIDHISFFCPSFIEPLISLLALKTTNEALHDGIVPVGNLEGLLPGATAEPIATVYAYPPRGDKAADGDPPRLIPNADVHFFMVSISTAW